MKIIRKIIRRIIKKVQSVPSNIADWGEKQARKHEDSKFWKFVGISAESYYKGNFLRKDQEGEAEKKGYEDKAIYTKYHSTVGYLATLGVEYSLPLWGVMQTQNNYDDFAFWFNIGVGASINLVRLGIAHKDKLRQIPFIEKSRKYFYEKISKINLKSPYLKKSLDTIFDEEPHPTPGVGWISGVVIAGHYVKNNFKKR